MSLDSSLDLFYEAVEVVDGRLRIILRQENKLTQQPNKPDK
jgi:hypothetical protein